MTAAVVSRVLAAAGMERAGKYSAWGYERDGFIAINAYGGGVTVMFTRRFEAARVECERAREVLEAKGYAVKDGGRNGVGGTYSLTVAA
jgi:hypothetical protein